MEKCVQEKYLKAGRIANSIREEVMKRIKPGIKILELAEFIEGDIRKKGGQPAFPVNISINDIAAHYTPILGDDKEVLPGDLVKIDVGVHVDGYIGDLAFTYCSEKNPLISCAEDVLKHVQKTLKPGVTVGQIGKTIEDFVKGRDLGVITNLTGHTLERFQFHGSPSIPNTENNSGHSFKEGDVIALEPFITESNGYVKESGTIEIFRYLQDRPVRLMEARKILELARDEYHKLPFAKRWLYKEVSPIKVSLAIRQLESVFALESYPVLREVSGKRIAQAEHTFIVSDKPIVTTRGENG